VRDRKSEAGLALARVGVGVPRTTCTVFAAFLRDKICTQKANRHAAGLGARADYFDMNIRGKIDTLMQKRISDYYRPLSHMQTAILEKY
jgi:hypothetical protein